MSKEVKVTPQRAVIAAVQLPEVGDEEFQASLDELRELAKTLGYEVVATFTQKRNSFDSTAYLGTGKREEIRRFVQGEAEKKDSERRIARHGAVAAREAAKALARSDTRQAAFLLVDHEISPSQARN